MIRVFDDARSSAPLISLRDRAELARYARARELLARIFRTRAPRHLRLLADTLASDDADVFPMSLPAA